jgi:hypothetical protein
MRYYLDAVDFAFGGDVDFAMIDKEYASAKRPENASARYSPPKLRAVSRKVITGNPDVEHISTSFVERHNLSVRMHLRRFTRLTNAFSKTREHLRASVALFMAWYNFCRVHQTLRVTPAMQSGLTDHVWTVSELLAA